MLYQQITAFKHVAKFIPTKLPFTYGDLQMQSCQQVGFILYLFALWYKQKYTSFVDSVQISTIEKEHSYIT